MMKAIGSLFTLAGETLSAIGRMIERPAFNDEAAEAYFKAGRDAAPRSTSTSWTCSSRTPVVFGAGTWHRHDWASCAAYFRGDSTSAANPDARRVLRGTELIDPTSPGASPVSQPAAAAVPGESVGATETHFGGGADRPLSELLGEAAVLLGRLVYSPDVLGYTSWLSYRNDALMLVPVLLDAAAQLRDTE